MQKSSNCGIYKIESEVNKKVYIGSSVKISSRLSAHRCKLKKGNHGNARLQHAWNKYGEQAFTFIVIEICEKNSLVEREQFWIDSLSAANRDTGYNIVKKAGGNAHKARPKGTFKHTPETRRKMSESARARPPIASYFERWGVKRKNKPLSDDHKRNVSKSLKGRTFTEAHRQKTSAALKGRVNPRAAETGRDALSKLYKITAPDQTVYNSVKGLPAFCKEHGLTRSSMGAVSQGLAKSHKGWKCEVIEEAKAGHQRQLH